MYGLRSPEKDSRLIKALITSWRRLKSLILVRGKWQSVVLLEHNEANVFEVEGIS